MPASCSATALGVRAVRRSSSALACDLARSELKRKNCIVVLLAERLSMGMLPKPAIPISSNAVLKPKSWPASNTIKSGAWVPIQRHNTWDTEFSEKAAPVGGNCNDSESGLALAMTIKLTAESVGEDWL